MNSRWLSLKRHNPSCPNPVLIEIAFTLIALSGVYVIKATWSTDVW